MAAFVEVFANFKTKLDTKPLDKGEKKLDKLAEAAKGALAIFGGGFAGAAIKGAIDKQIEFANSIDQVSQQLGINSDSYQEWSLLTRQAGADTEELKEIMLDVAERAGDAATGNETFSETFRSLGVNIRDSNGQLKSAGVLFEGVIQGLNGIDDETTKLFRARELSGQFNRIFPLINQSSEALESQRKELRETGAIMRRDYIARLQRVRQQQERVKASLQGLTNDALAKFLPFVERAIKGTQDMVRWFRETTKGVDLVRVAVLALTPILLTLLKSAILPILSPLGMLVAKAVAVALAIDDLAEAYEGGQSAIRNFFMEFLGFDILSVIDPIVDGFFAMVDAVKIFGLNLKKLLADLGIVEDFDLDKAVGKIERNSISSQRSRSAVREFRRDQGGFITGEQEAALRGGISPRFAATPAPFASNSPMITTIEIKGGDPQATARAVRRELERTNRRNSAGVN